MISMLKKNEDKEIDSLIESYVKVPRDTERVRKLKLIINILTWVSILASAMFVFLPIYYRVMSIVCMLLFILSFALYIKYNDVVSFIDRRRDWDFARENANVTFAMLAPAFSLTARTVIDFIFLDYKIFWIWTSALAVLILLLFFMFTEEYKKYHKSAIMIIVFAVLFYAPSAVAQTNAVFDFSKSKVTQSTVQQIEKSKNAKTGYSYYMKVKISNGKVLKFYISEEDYYKLSVGDIIIMYEKPGFLKIPNLTLSNTIYKSRW